MLVESHDSLTKPTIQTATRVVIRDNHGNPIAVALQISPAQIFVKRRGEAGFDQALAQLGIRDTVVEDIVRPGPVEIRA